jgi:fumarylacetoacetase
MCGKTSAITLIQTVQNGMANKPMNDTHNPALKSWIEAANAPDCEFPIQNLPFGVFSTDNRSPRVGVAIGDHILDLAVLEAESRPYADDLVFNQPTLNAFMAEGSDVWSETRAMVSRLLSADEARLRDDDELRAHAMVLMNEADMHMPFAVADYTDFYSSREHATNVGTMFRGVENALPPNWLHIPIGYNGRASTVVPTGTPVIRPLGQLKGPNETRPRFAPCEKLDIELELGAVVGASNRMGQPITTAQAAEMIFGYVLLNDWSARDIQVWEYQPLGPFQAKAFATTISPWVVTAEALEPYRTPTPTPEKPLLPYLEEDKPGLYDINLEVALEPSNGEAQTITRTNFKHMYFSAGQQLTHHASGGCAMRVGDLLGSGTISGPTRDSCGSLLEITWNGTEPLQVDGGERQFLEDGDTVTITGHCQGDGHRIGFGECAGTIRPSPEISSATDD